MFVKQIDMAKALELAAKGMEIKFEAGTETGQTGRGGKRMNVDIGKMKALREAGWSYAKIADEMRISVGSVHNHLKQAEEEAK